MNCREIIETLEIYYPRSAAEEWDNPGLLVGHYDQEVKRIFTALDATEDTIAQAAAFQADLIVTHHPMIFHGIRQINDRDIIGSRILTLAENHISCYAMHTNFDVCQMADLNARMLRLEDCVPLKVTQEKDGVPYGIGKIGSLPVSMTLREFSEYVKRQFELPDVRCYGTDDDVRVRRVAVCGGSGKSLMEEAVSSGAQAFVTGDIDYHTAIDALSAGLHVIDAGHYGTEYCFIRFMTDRLKELFPSCEIACAEIRQPFDVI